MQLLRHTDIELIELQPQPPSPNGCGRTWPCPLCGQRRLVDRAAQANVRDRVAPSFQRWILVCSDCVVRLGELVSPSLARGLEV